MDYFFLGNKLFTISKNKAMENKTDREAKTVEKLKCKLNIFSKGI